jgi:hypothetical protein
MLLPPAAIAQERSPVSVRCETFCSKQKLRTASARIIWRDGAPGAPLRPGAAGDTRAAPQIDVTVVKNGFAENAYATIPTTQAGAGATQGPAAATEGRPRLRAYDLRVVGTRAPGAPGPAAASEIAGSAEPQETSTLIENLEPGLRYSWRLRFDTAAGAQVTVPVTCTAPICPADIKSKR